MQGVAIGTRFWGKDPAQMESIEDFIKRARTCADQVFIAVNIEEDKIGTIDNEKLKIPGVHIFGVTPWGKFVLPLNALVSKAKLAGAETLLLASVEVNVSTEHLLRLRAHMTKNTLVVGAAMTGHKLKEGKQIGDGYSTPWNVLSLWNLEYLSRVGFPLIGDALFDQRYAGVEEVSAIGLLQQIYPQLTAKLIEISGGVEWKTDDFDAERLAKHLQKMKNKIERPAKQMEILGLPAPEIIHIRS